jgi:hypothetical protein
MWKGAASSFIVWAYSPGWSRKKKPSKSIWAIACAIGEVLL